MLQSWRNESVMLLRLKIDCCAEGSPSLLLAVWINFSNLCCLMLAFASF